MVGLEVVPKGGCVGEFYCPIHVSDKYKCVDWRMWGDKRKERVVKNT